MERSAITYTECRGDSRTGSGIPRGNRHRIDNNVVLYRFVFIFLLLLCHASDLLAATLSGSEELLPSTVNLTQEGTSDWVHWGRNSASSIDRKAGVSPQISNYTLLGATAPSRFIDARAAYAWSDGTPTAAESGTTTGLYFSGVGNGYELTLPADTTTRSARIYLGGWKARGELTVTLSDNSAPAYTVTIDNPNGIIDQVVKLDYAAASAGQSLAVHYHLVDDYGLSGNITLQAVTLQEAAKSSNSAPVFEPIPDQSVAAGNALTFTVTASDPDGTVPALSASGLPGSASFVDNGNGTGQFNWTTVAGDTGSYSVTFTASDGMLSTNASATISVVSSSVFLNGSVLSLPSKVDLTQEGTGDWVHWGRDSATSVNRKAGVTAQISNYTLLGTTAPSRFTNARAAYAWSDGTPNATESGTTTGLFFRGVGNGYELSLPADNTSRTARLYLGGWKARGELTVTLSDNSAPAYTVTIDNPNGIIDQVVKLDYAAASAGQTLVVRYQLMDDYGLSGNITLQAVTLQSTNSLSLPLTYDFQDGTANGWSAPVDDSGNPSAWVVEGGVMRQDAYVEARSTGHPYLESYHLGTYRYLQGLTASDYRFSVDITPLPNPNPDDIDGNDVGVMFRYQDPNNYYRLSFNARYGFARLEKRVGGQFTTLAVDARGYTDSQIFRVTVVVAGSRMQLFVDQGADGRSVESRFAVRDTSLSTGTVALYAQDSAAFDNVALKAILAGPPAIVLSTPTSQSIVPDGNLMASAVAIPTTTTSTVNFYLNGVLCNASPLTSSNGFYSTNCGLPKSGDNTVKAVMTRNGTNYTDTHVGIAMGDYIVGVGDSITNGIGDRFSGDNGTSVNGRIVASQGYEGVLSDLLAGSIYPSQIVFNEGVGGDTTLDCIGRIDSIVARHANGNDALLLLGTNDSGGSLPVPSGLGCTGDACSGTYKGQMQQIIDTMIGAGLSVRVAQVPPAWGTATQPYAYPLSA